MTKDEIIKQIRDDEITRQIYNFFGYMFLGWELSLAFECCYDAIHDRISKRDFIILLQSIINGLDSIGGLQ
jgi:hypothetical protein